MVLALRQWYPLVSGWRGIWTGWPWGVAGNWVCVERETDLWGELAPCSQDGVGLAGMSQLGFPQLLYLH